MCQVNGNERVERINAASVIKGKCVITGKHPETGTTATQASAQAEIAEVKYLSE